MNTKNHPTGDLPWRISRILVATDFSDQASKALEWARSFAGAFGALDSDCDFLHHGVSSQLLMIRLFVSKLALADAAYQPRADPRISSDIAALWSTGKRSLIPIKLSIIHGLRIPREPPRVAQLTASDGHTHTWR